MNLSTDKVREYYNSVAKGYDDLYYDGTSNTYIDKISQLEDEFIEEKIKKLLSSRNGPIRVLDLGCGTGYGAEICLNFLSQNPDQRVEYTGVDISQDMIDIARKKFPENASVKFDTGNMTDLSIYPDGQFDIVISLYGSIGHVEDIKLAIQEMTRCTKLGGSVFIMPYSRYSFKNLSSLLLDFDKRHLDGEQDYKIRASTDNTTCPAYFRTSKQLTALLRSNGLSPLQYEGFHLLQSSETIKALTNKFNLHKFAFDLDVVIGSLFPDLGHYLLFEGTKQSPAPRV